MTPDKQADQYRRMKAIVADLMQEDPSSWETLAGELAAGDGDLKAMVLDVLHHMQEETGKVEMGVESPMPNRLGPYRILETLGHGGMGIVYLAERTDQFRQKVAIKCLRAEFANAEDATRFHLERQILARLNHPNIAKILDGGITDQGLPYFVMEYIEGVSLMQYANDHDLNLKQRLALFQEIAKAVQYANQNLIVHRDLKPGNILVENNGMVKLLDFGIAKLLDQTDPYFSDVASVQTKTGKSLMTLQYASPEQYQGAQVTIATDVYALGLLLYELLTGKPAYDLGHLSREQVGQVILHQMPALPSKRVAAEATAEEKPGYAVTHGMNARVLKTRLEGDLDCIMMMALRKEPERRYASVSELLKDIHAHLNGQPVAAHPEKWTYHFAKFVGRNRLLVGFSSAILLSLLAMTLLSIRFARITKEKNIAIAAERDQAQAISRFMVHLLEESDPIVQNTNPTIKEVLVRALADLEDNSTVGKDARTEIQLTLIDVLLSYDFYEKAESLIETLLAASPSPENRLRLRGQKAALLGSLGKFRQAWPIYDEVIATLADQGPAETLERMRLMKAIHQIDATLYSEAVAGLKALLAMDLKAKPEIKISAWRNLGRAFSEMGQFDKADEAFDEAESQVRATFGPNAMALFDIDLNRIITMTGRGQFEEGLKTAEAAIPKMISVLGETHGLACGALAVKATCLAGLGRLEEALALRLKALDCTKAAFGETHHQVIFLLNEIGLTYSTLGRKEEAIATYREAIRLGEANLPQGHLLRAIPHTNLGSALRQIGKPEEGLVHNRKAYDAVKANPDIRIYLPGCTLLVARAFQGLERHDEALAYFHEAIQVAGEFPDQLSFPVGMIHFLAASSYRALNREAEAVASLEVAFEDYLSHLGQDDPGTQMVYQQLVQAYQDRGDAAAKMKLQARMQPRKNADN